MWVSKAANRCATNCPMRPSPTTPTVLPKISVPENDDLFQACSRSEASAAGIWRAADSSSAKACSAALWMFDVGALTTSAPRSVAVSTSTLASPTPARATIFSFGAASSTSASTVVAERTSSASASGTAASSFSRSGPSTQPTSIWSPSAATVDSASLSAIRTTGRLTRPAYAAIASAAQPGAAYDEPVTKLAIIYYSATGHGTTMAKRVAAAAESAGAEVRLRHVAETNDPESFAHNPAWTANYQATKDLPAATRDDILLADAVIFGSPTRFGSPAAQLRPFIDSLGGLWAEGKLADKAYAAFTSSNTLHGGQETTLLALYITLIHWGGIIVPPGYTDPCKYVDGNPYGVSLVTTDDNIAELDEATGNALDHMARRVVSVADRLGS